MALERFDEKLVRGVHVNFQDKGIVSKGAKTRKFLVTNRYNNSVIGNVRFFAQWRQYVFVPLNCLLNGKCMIEIAAFCEEVTTAQRQKRQPFPASVEESVVEASGN